MRHERGRQELESVRVSQAKEIGRQAIEEGKPKIEEGNRDIESAKPNSKPSNSKPSNSKPSPLERDKYLNQ